MKKWKMLLVIFALCGGYGMEECYGSDSQDDGSRGGEIDTTTGEPFEDTDGNDCPEGY